MYYNRKKAAYILLAIILFLIGRYWPEISNWFNSQYSIVGLAIIIFTVLLFVIIYYRDNWKRTTLLKSILESDKQTTIREFYEEKKKNIELKEEIQELLLEKKQLSQQIKILTNKKK